MHDVRLFVCLSYVGLRTYVRTYVRMYVCMYVCMLAANLKHLCTKLDAIFRVESHIW